MAGENQETPQDQVSVERAATQNQAVSLNQEGSMRQSLLSKIASIFKRGAPGIAKDIATGEAQRKLNPFSTELSQDSSPEKVSEPSKS